MALHVGFLRAINLGNRNRVPMAELRQLMSELGFTDVRTHLQSGNVIFDAASRERDELGETISAAVADRFGVTTEVVVRTAGELVKVVKRNPLPGEPDDPARFLVGFLGGTPAPEAVRTLEQRSFGVDRLWVVGEELYLWCPSGIRDSELMKVSWEKQLRVTATTRNWKTVTKLASMIGV